jgi:Na+-transporting NADH:ubiquinone oxidoreductase subunit NqrC
MADEKIENGQEMEEVKPLSLFDEKMKGLLDELDERLEQIGGDFGPILMEELQNRLERIVKNFNEEVHTLFSESFKKWKVTDTQLREFVKADFKLLKRTKAQKKPKKTSTPEFIKDVEFGPIRSK